AVERFIETGRGSGLGCCRGCWGEGADVGHQAARLLLADLLAPARHLGFLTVEDARQELRIGPPRLPGGLGEVGDLGQAVARRTPRAVGPMALDAVLLEQLAGGGCFGCCRGRLPRGGRCRDLEDSACAWIGVGATSCRAPMLMRKKSAASL